MTLWLVFPLKLVHAEESRTSIMLEPSIDNSGDLKQLRIMEKIEKLRSMLGTVEKSAINNSKPRTEGNVFIDTFRSGSNCETP